MHYHLVALLLIVACCVNHGEVVSNGLALPAAAVCDAANKCQLVPNSVDVRCTDGVCTPECVPGFEQISAACVSANIACGKGQQPHSSGTRCVVCPRNSYKDTQGNMPCTRCPNGTFTAGRRAQSHDSITKCLAGGLTSSATGVKAPRLQHFRRHLSAAQSYMHSTLETRQPLPCSQGCSTAAIKRLTKPVAYIAASPQVVSPRHRLLRMPAERPHVQNQGLCATCVNAAISSAAEAAAAVEAGTNTSGIAFSPVYAYYCEPTMLRSCASGWTLKDALDGLASATVRYLPHATCTHNVDLERIRTVAPSQLPAACDAVYNKCLSLRLVSECTYTALTDFWEIQRAIRLSGAAITRVSVGADFVEYFQSNPRGIYNLTSITNSSGTVPHAVILTGYNNTGQYWWAQNSYGTAFANQGVFKIAYGTALVGNPNETYALSCSLNPLYPTNPLKRWPLQVLPHTSLQPMPCYSYTTRAGDYLAGIADHFGIDLLQMVAENAYVLSTTLANRPDLSTSIAGKRLLLCGITKDLYKTAHLDCGAGEYQSSVTGRCQVCPHDTYKTRKGPTPCRACLPGTVTNGCNAADHDSPNDCTPAIQQHLCEQFIGRYGKSGVFNVTLRCKDYQVFCDMETDGGGWTLLLSYNVAANTYPRETYSRSLNDGFPLLSGNALGVDESSSVGPGGSWGHMAPRVVKQIPNFAEFLGVFETINPDNPSEVLRAHYKSAEARTLNFLKTEYLAGAPTDGVNLNNVRHSYTPMPDHNGFIPSDGEGKFVPSDLWSLALAGLPVRHAVYMRGSNVQPPVCEPGWYQVGWSCHICPDHTYKDAHGPGPCSVCPDGKVSGASIQDKRSADLHDDPSDCRIAQPDISWNTSRPDGSTWILEFFWSVRARAEHAEEICRVHGGHLVTLESEYTAKQVADKVTGDDTGRPFFPTLHPLNIVWTGLHSLEPSASRNGPWMWYSGAAYNHNTNYTNWAESQPDNFWEWQGHNAALLLDNNNMWDDYYQFMLLEFVCERRTMS